MSILAPSKAPTLLMDVDERLSLLATVGAKSPRNVRAVRFTRAFAAQSPEAFADFLRRVYPALECIHCGGNWRFGANGAGTPATLRKLGFAVKVVRYARYKGERVSSTRIRTALAAGDVEDANAMLGRNFAVDGRVVRGKGAGSGLGSPTLNVEVSLPLRRGVYAVLTPFGPGVANYGVAPTMGNEAWKEPVLEVHVICGRTLRRRPRTLRTEFLSFLRPERSFASQEALRRRIAADIDEALDFHTINGTIFAHENE